MNCVDEVTLHSNECRTPVKMTDLKLIYSHKNYKSRNNDLQSKDGKFFLDILTK